MNRRYPSVALDSKARAFLESLAESPNTRATYEYALQAFYSFRRSFVPTTQDDAPAPPALGLKRMDANVLVQFNVWLARRYESRFTRKTYLAAVTAFLDFAIDQEWLAPEFSLDRARYRKRKATRKKQAYPIAKIPDGIERALTYYDRLSLPTGDAAQAERLRILRGRAVMHVLYSSAGRISEVASLTRKHVQDGRRDEAEIVGKGDKERFLFLTEEARAAIAAYVAARADTAEPLFIRHSKGYGAPLSRSMLWKIVIAAGKASGVQALHPHHIRHFRARQMLEEGAPIEAIQELLGHDSLDTTRRIYAPFQKKTSRAIFERTTIPLSRLQAREEV